ncbi:hypothetical protein [Antarctobacter heliothermus]|nr:hypothetical protein [Antarctobacter heliothermus]
MARLVPLLAATAVALSGAGAAAWWLTQSGSDAPDTPQGAFMALCNTAMPLAEADPLIRQIGWVSLDATGQDALLDATGTFHVASRVALGGPFDAEQERAVYDAQIADMREDLAKDGVMAYGFDDDAMLAVYNSDADGLPNTAFCALFIADEGQSDWYYRMIDAFPYVTHVHAWASSVSTDGQQPRPGLWVATLALIRKDGGSSAEWQQLTDMLGAEPKYRTLSRNGFRGELSK